MIQTAGDDLELVGISAHSSWRAGLRAGPEARRSAGRDRRPRGGRALRGVSDPGVLAGEEGVRELIATSGADLVLNAITGSAGLGPTIVALTEGIDLALANKESLVVGGELVTALAEATDARDHPGRLRALGALPADRGERRPGSVDRLVLTASGGPFRERDGPRRRHRRRGARASDLGHGRADHDRLRDALQQGPRADRGASPLRRSPTRRSTSSCTRSRSSTRSST